MYVDQHKASEALGHEIKLNDERKQSWTVNWEQRKSGVGFFGK